ncbi:hypothetical protein QZH41_018902 [Actinostola sp. cb2023]|nr:hypothetical protein QZH41_018902 [Actinostola sp. cb2023]
MSSSGFGNYSSGFDIPGLRHQEVGLGDYNDFSSISSDDGIKIERDKDRPDSLTILKRKDPNDDAEKTGAEIIKKIRLDEGSSKSPDQVIVSSPKHIPKNSPHLSPRGSAAASPGSSPGSTMSSDDPVIVGQISPRAKLIGMKLELEKKEQISSIDDKVTIRSPDILSSDFCPIIFVLFSNLEKQTSTTPQNTTTKVNRPINSLTKEGLIQSMEKLDRDITQTDQQILNLKKKQQLLEEEAAKVSVEPPREPSPPPEPKVKSLVQTIYEDNRRKAQSAHAQLSKLDFPLPDGKPLYNQPSDLPIYHENIRRAPAVKAKLIKYFQLRRQAKEIKNRQLCKEYKTLKRAWVKKMERLENNAKRRAKESKVREFYEKIFPEIKKQREQSERFSRMGARSSWGMVARRLIRDPMALLNERKYRNIWTDKEKQIFKEKYTTNPKNFVLIAAYIENKSVADCILYYYQSKKKENYKQLSRKHTHKRRRREALAISRNSNTGKTCQSISEGGRGRSAFDGEDDVDEMTDSAEESDHEENSLNNPQGGGIPGISSNNRSTTNTPQPMSSKHIGRSEHPETSRWTEKEMDIAMQGLREKGRDWTAISKMVVTKTDSQCKNFYFNYKKKFHLEAMVAEFESTKVSTGAHYHGSQSKSSCSPSRAFKEPNFVRI